MARTRTLTNLIADVRYQADIENELRRHPTLTITRLINQSINALRLKISSSGHPYYLAESASANTVSGTDDYAVPSDMIALYGVNITVNNRVQSMQDFALVERNDYSSESYPSTGIPVMYRLHETGYVRFIPTPDSAYAYQFVYLPTATDLSSGTDTFDGIAGWEDWVVYDVAFKIAVRDENEELAGGISALLGKKEQEIMSWAKKRHRGNPAHRQDYRGHARATESWARRYPV
jgi:hypothetical protein